MVRIRRGDREHERDFRDPQDDFSWNDVPPWAIQMIDQQGVITRMLQRVLERQEYEMRTFAEMGDAIARNSSAIDSAVSVFQDISERLRAAQASGDPQAMSDAIDHLDANTNRLAAGIVKGTPVDTTPGQPLPPPAPTPTPDQVPPDTGPVPTQP